MSEPIPPYQPGGQPPPYPPPPPHYYQRPPERRSRWWIPVVIIGGVIALFFIGIVVVFMIIGSAIGSSFESQPVQVETQSVLHLKVPGVLEEIDGPEGFSLFSSDRVPVNFMNTLTAIKRAKDDDDIVGIYFEGGVTAGFAKSTELRDALVDFKKSGKFIYAFMETGAEDSYYFASVADSIFMPTEGLLEMNGFAIISPFFKEALNKLGVDFYVQQFEEYKSAGESFSRTNFSEPARRELKDVLSHRYAAFTGQIAESRGMSVEAVRSALNRGVYTADTLLGLGFIDGIKSQMDTKEWIRAQVNAENKGDSLEKLRLVSLKDYINSSSFASKEKVDEDKQIAVVFGSGAIVPGRGDSGPFADNEIASERFIKELRKARDNDKVKAIILRIDSPGGSVIASDAIWSEVREARKVKPVYASMSDVAASGGYYIAMACDTIIAHPQTVTGSIGVILMIPNITGALDNLGIAIDTVKTSEAATFLNPTMPFSEAEKAKLHSLSENIYRRFVSRVAESRGKTFEQAREVAKGRVWTGSQAREVGLVDVLGGLQTSIDIAKKRIGVSPDKKVVIRIYPEPRDPIEQFFSMLGGDDEEDATLASRLQKNMQPGVEHMPMWDLVPAPVKSQVRYMLRLNEMALHERTLMAMPMLVEAK